MFYDKFTQLCSIKQVAPSKAAVEAGISKSLVTKWKTNQTQVPSPEILQKLSAYFSVPVSELLEENSEEKKENPDQPELTEGEKELLELFRLVPEAQQPMVLNMIRAALGKLQ